MWAGDENGKNTHGIVEVPRSIIWEHDADTSRKGGKFCLLSVDELGIQIQRGRERFTCLKIVCFAVLSVLYISRVLSMALLHSKWQTFMLERNAAGILFLACKFECASFRGPHVSQAGVAHLHAWFIILIRIQEPIRLWLREVLS